MPPSFDPSLWPAYAAALLFGYLCGSIPFGLILTRLAGAGDVRAIGSGNIGATNVLRTGRKGLAAATLIGDALKGTLAVLLVYAYYGNEYRYFADELALPAAAAPGPNKRGGMCVTHTDPLRGYGFQSPCPAPKATTRHAIRR
jgi:hypothetical protein